MTQHKRAEDLAKRVEARYGHKSASLGSDAHKLNVIPTGSLALDYALGTGGWPLGHPVEIYGEPDIGKSGILGFGAIRNAQALGKLCALIALEPSFDEAWARKNGVSTDELVIARPNTGEDAFGILLDCINGGADYVVFDSIGALVTAGERDQEEMKSKVGGQASLITDGVKRCLTPCWKNNVGVMFLNQVRDDMKARVSGLVESPGGWALKHSAAIRVHLRSTGPPIKTKVSGDDVIVGRELVTTIKRNKLSEGSNRKAQFIYYQMATEDHPVGIDQTSDVIATGMRTGVIEQAGAWYRHNSFPDEKGFRGKASVQEFFETNPAAVGAIRDEVMAEMFRQQNEKPELKVADGG